MPFSHKILELPAKVIKDINTSIDQNLAFATIRKLILARHKKVHFPGHKSFDRYVRWYKTGETLPVKQVGITQEVFEPTIDTNQIMNKKVLLENLIYQVNNRLTDLTKYQDNRFDFRNETTLIRYVTSIQELVKTLVTLKDDLDIDTSKIDGIVQQHLIEIFSAMKYAIQRVAPEKAIEFQKTFLEIYKQKHLIDK
jgi:hypothetical protein